MATRKNPLESDKPDNQARDEQDKLLAGSAAAFGQAGEFGMQALALQQALLGGIAGSQRREAARLARAGADDPRIAEALERAGRFEALHAEAQRGAGVAAQLLATFEAEGLFHGYVSRAAGEPAEGYTVELKVRRPGQRVPEAGSAKTDASGYFRIDLARPSGTPDQLPPRPGRGFERLARMAAAEEAPAPDGTADAEAVESSVQVIDQAGRVVFDDPVPPTFEGGMAEFRYYVLPATARGRASRK